MCLLLPYTAGHAGSISSLEELVMFSLHCQCLQQSISNCLVFQIMIRTFDLLTYFGCSGDIERQSLPRERKLLGLALDRMLSLAMASLTVCIMMGKIEENTCFKLMLSSCSVQTNESKQAGRTRMNPSCIQLFLPHSGSLVRRVQITGFAFYCLYFHLLLFLA